MPRSDNATVLREAAQRRSRAARERAEQAITEAQRGREPVTVAAIAAAARVSRSWLYTQADLISAVETLKNGAPSPARTGRQPASDESVHRRLDAALHRIKQLRAENRELAQRLETAHGQIRRLRIAQEHSQPPQANQRSSPPPDRGTVRP